jgi:hypothetical protein
VDSDLTENLARVDVVRLIMRNGLCGASVGMACRPEVSQLWSVFRSRLAMSLHFERQLLRANGAEAQSDMRGAARVTPFLMDAHEKC